MEIQKKNKEGRKRKRRKHSPLQRIFITHYFQVTVRRLNIDATLFRICNKRWGRRLLCVKVLIAMRRILLT